MANDFIAVDLIERLAWSLVHSLWQGTLIALAAAWLRLLLPSPRWRYGISAAALLMMLAAPVLTFLFAGNGDGGASLGTAAEPGAPVFLLFTGSGEAAAWPWSRWIVLAWLAGVGVCLIRLLGAWQATRKLLTVGTAPAAPAAAHLASALSARLRLQVPVRLLESRYIDSPVAIGWLRPVVLLPAAAVTGLTPAQLEAVLAHELAHVRRHDFLVNVVQRCVECLLFYHPAVWWLSARIRADREECCDDVALASCSDAATYASALLELERARSVGSLAMAGTGGSLTRRVRRLLGSTSVGRDWRDVLPAVALVAVVLTTAFYWADVLRAQPAADDAPQPALTPEAAPRSEAAAAPGSAATQEEEASPDAAAAPPALSWVLLQGETVLMSGSSEDLLAARSAQATLGSNVLWFRHPQGTYVIREPALLQRVIEMHAPQRDLAERQAALAAEQRALAQEMRERRVEVDTSSIEARLAEFSAHLPAAATQQELGEIQRALGELQREIGQLQAQAGREQARIGRMQGEHGRQQAALGREQANVARRVQREVGALLHEAVETGDASPW